ncbi:hypothetical protein SJA_C1-18240 [Sphingobium indicum UT26S]|uniref:Uncharacterized protein n=1 Tax=Sphingobium indicum (strain DSM 16413 / CCM 7287 / MTCC 6362 / UT26 / NBRC 101211 / UT26S) TaxID=452662 RepID=D4Z226_SPHIU|nr:hypothetical protein SJA_C1-18240 [Sphingobium indicum UT26S]
MTQLSPLRARLISFDAAYSVALAARAASSADHFIIRTGNPLQPYRVTTERPRDPSDVLARVA